MGSYLKMLLMKYAVSKLLRENWDTELDGVMRNLLSSMVSGDARKLTSDDFLLLLRKLPDLNCDYTLAIQYLGFFHYATALEHNEVEMTIEHGNELARSTFNVMFDALPLEERWVITDYQTMVRAMHKIPVVWPDHELSTHAIDIAMADYGPAAVMHTMRWMTDAEINLHRHRIFTAYNTYEPAK